MNNKLLTIKDVQDRLNVSRQTVYNLTTRGKLKYIRIGRAVRFEQSEIENFIANLFIKQTEQAEA